MKLIYSFLALALCCSFIACSSDTNEKTTEEFEVSVEDLAAEQIERGSYLVNTNGCHDCHSPKVFSEKGMEVNPELVLSGHPADEALPPYDAETAKGYVLFSMGLTSTTGPWGTSYAANLTPHETGLGNMTEDQFLYCIKNGVYKGMEGGRSLLPPMPWQHYKNFTDDDLRSIFAYLQSLEPVANIVPAPIAPKG